MGSLRGLGLRRKRRIHPACDVAIIRKDLRQKQMKRTILLAAFGGVFAVAQSSKDVWVMNDQQVNSTLASIRGADPNKPVVGKQVGTFAGHSLTLIQRNANGEVEVHMHKHDMVFVRQGA